MFKRQSISKHLFIGLTFLASSSHAVSISLDKITHDIATLASDDMQGRANFSPEIEKAAQYIASRYQAIGLTPLANNNDFLQTFKVYQVSPQNSAVVINGKEIANTHLASASAITQLSWQQSLSKNVKVSIVGPEDDMREVVGNINQVGGNNLVIIDPTHEKMFKRYQHYFQSGLTKLSLNPEHALVMVLSDEKNVSQYQVAIANNIEKKSLSNVVGMLPGKSKPEEIIIYSAHYDHLGTKQANSTKKQNGSDDVIYNGADDDASGTAAVINLAEHFAKLDNNQRTLMFTAFSAEEIGGFGSRYFSKQLDPNSIIAMINIEMVGKPSKFGEGQVWMTGMDRSNLGDLLNQQLGSNKSAIHADPYPEQNLFYRSDNATLARLGVPAHSFSSTQIDKDHHYHQVSDDLSSLDLLSLQQVIQNLAIATEPLVNKNITPSRVDVEQVKAKGKIY